MGCHFFLQEIFLKRDQTQSPALQANSLPSELPGNPNDIIILTVICGSQISGGQKEVGKCNETWELSTVPSSETGWSHRNSLCSQGFQPSKKRSQVHQITMLQKDFATHHTDSTQSSFSRDSYSPFASKAISNINRFIIFWVIHSSSHPHPPQNFIKDRNSSLSLEL